MAQVYDERPLRHLLLKVKMRLPDLELKPRVRVTGAPKTTISRKALQAYFDSKFGNQDLTPQKSAARSISYSKLLQETPDTFRQQHTSRKLVPSLLQRQLKKVSSIGGIQGIKSVITGKRVSATRASKIDRRNMMKTLPIGTREKGFNCSYNEEESEEFDPDAIDICPDIYLRTMCLERKSEVSFPRLLLK